MQVEMIPFCKMARAEIVSNIFLKSQPAIRKWTEESVARMLGKELINFLRDHKDMTLVVRLVEGWRDACTEEIEHDDAQVYDARVVIHELVMVP